MRKIIIATAAILVVLAAVFAWFLFGSATAFSENKRFLYVPTGKANLQAVITSIDKENLIANPKLFEWTASRMKMWDKLKPGRYEIKKGESIVSIVRKLRNNQQASVNLVINKIRTNEEIARIIGKNFETDSTEVLKFISNPDSLTPLGVDTNTLMTTIIPNTYTFYWTSSAGKILRRLETEKDNWWKKNNRLKKAEAMGFTPKQIYTIASIVEEETNKNDEKGNVASVYINRYQKGMPLGADPTIKFALKDFGLKRIYFKHLQVVSPYNTYKNAGLPPGPICTPSARTIDEVLKAPKTDYIFFVAKSDFSGYHSFSNNYVTHMQLAKEYQKALDEMILRRQKKTNANL